MLAGSLSRERFELIRAVAENGRGCHDSLAQVAGVVGVRERRPFHALEDRPEKVCLVAQDARAFRGDYRPVGGNNRRLVLGREQRRLSFTGRSRATCQIDGQRDAADHDGHDDVLGVHTSTVVVPVSSLNGLVVNTSFGARLTAKPAKNMNLSGNYKFDDRDNRTDVHIYQWDDWARRTVPVPLVVDHMARLDPAQGASGDAFDLLCSLDRKSTRLNSSHRT